MDKLEAMRVFIEVAECRSFVAASRKLELSAPAVTRTIAQLEQSMGVRLFNRSTRHVRLTDSGDRFYYDARRILEDLELAIAAASGSYAEPKGVLTVTAPVLFGQRHVAPILTEYLQQNPSVRVKSVFYDRICNLLDEGVEVAIRIGHLRDSSIYAINVGNVKRVVCASPGYIKNHGMPMHPSELKDHEIINASGVELSTSWQFDSSAGKVAVKVSPRLHCNQIGTAIAAAIQGFGITRVMSYQLGEALSNGSLVRLLCDYESQPLPVNIVHLEGRQANAKIRAFIELAVARLRASPFINH